MNPNYLPHEMCISNQEIIIRELQQIPNQLLAWRAKLDENNMAIVLQKNKLLEKEYTLETERMNAVTLTEFNDLKNDTQRKAFIFTKTQVQEEEVIIAKQQLLVAEANLEEIQKQYELTYQKLWALKTASQQISAYMFLACRVRNMVSLA